MPFEASSTLKERWVLAPAARMATIDRTSRESCQDESPFSIRHATSIDEEVGAARDENPQEGLIGNPIAVYRTARPVGWTPASIRMRRLPHVNHCITANC
jgi:hypothetical protein